MKVKNLVLGIGIVVVFALLLWQAIETFYPSPEFDRYCNVTGIPVPVVKGIDMSNNATYCLEHNGTWREGFCDLYYKCQQGYEAAMRPHSQVVFLVSLIAALIVIVAGYFFLRVEPVGSALIGCGIWALFWGSAVNWRNFANYMRFILLLIAFVFIIWLALRLNKNIKGKR